MLWCRILGHKIRLKDGRSPYRSMKLIYCDRCNMRFTRDEFKQTTKRVCRNISDQIYIKPINVWICVMFSHVYTIKSGKLECSRCLIATDTVNSYDCFVGRLRGALRYKITKE